jgi:hypothetical protein
MEMGGSVLAHDAQGLTPLHWAATKGQEEIVRIMMRDEEGDACLAQHAFGRTPLYCAASSGYTEIVRSVVEKMGCGILPALEENGHTPLHFAVGKGHLETVKLLLELGANVDPHAKDGRTPLHWAAASGMVETLKVLIEMGANVLAPDANRCTPLYFADFNGHEAAGSFLRKIAINKLRSKSTTAPVVDPAVRAAAEAAAAAMAALLLAEEEDEKQALPSKQGNSNKARKPEPDRKSKPRRAGPTGFKGLTEGLGGGSVASSSGKTRDNAGADMGTDATRLSKPDGKVGAHGGEENDGLIFKSHAQRAGEGETGPIGGC